MKLRIEESSFSGTRILLTEKSLSRILKDHHVNGYIILSASREYIRKNGDPCKSDDNEMVLLDLITGEIVDESDLITGQRLSAENNKRTADLRKSIISYNLSFLPVLGGYRYDDGTESYEKSFIIFPFDRKGNPIEWSSFEKIGKELGKEFNQESILINGTKSNPYYYKIEDGSKSMEFSGNIDDWKINDLTQSFFTALRQYDKKKYPNYSGSSQRFTLENVYLAPQPDSIMSGHERCLSGELCMPVSAWRKLYERGSL